ncbi:hypothetical protein HPB47_023075, partial [Ixodes persulcatus]
AAAQRLRRQAPPELRPNQHHSPRMSTVQRVQRLSRLRPILRLLPPVPAVPSMLSLRLAFGRGCTACCRKWHPKPLVESEARCL